MTEFTNTQIADVLEEAAEHIRAGWTQNRMAEFVDDKRYVCGSGAIFLGAGCQIDPAGMSTNATTTTAALVTSGWDRYGLWKATLRQLQAYVGEDVPSWNDSIGQTQERVVDTMLRLAKELRNNEAP